MGPRGLTCRMSESASINWVVLCAYWLYDALQMIICAVPPSGGVGWESSPLMSTVYRGLLSFSLLPYTGSRLSDTAKNDTSLWIAAVLLVACLAFLASWRALSHGLDWTYRPSWPLRLLRAGTMLATHAVFVPFVAVLTSPLNCPAGSYWGRLECGSSGQLGKWGAQCVLQRPNSPCSFSPSRFRFLRAPSSRLGHLPRPGRPPLHQNGASGRRLGPTRKLGHAS
jgi:hypothetical protein